MPIKEECGLCGKVLPYSLLRRCFRCRRFYCDTCIEYLEDGNIVCLNCARRMVSPRKFGTKYSPLTIYLTRKAHYTDMVTLSFHQIEGIIGGSLPLSAFQDEGWWQNNPSSAHEQAWLSIGWHVENVDLKEKTVTFRREKGILHLEKKGKKRKQKQKKLQKPLAKVQPRRRRKPSKTKMAKLIARLKNIERRKMAANIYPRKKSPHPYEKKLFKAKQAC